MIAAARVPLYAYGRLNTPVHAPHVDFAALSPLIALLGGATVVLLVGLARRRAVREHVVPALSLVTLGAALGLTVWQWGSGRSIVSGALRVDDLALALNLVFIGAAAAAVALAWRDEAPCQSSPGEFHSLLLTSVAGMATLVSAQSLVTLFVGIELLSIPLYVLCASQMRRRSSLESGLKYLIIGSLGSATLLYGLALVYGATGTTDFAGIAAALSGGAVASDPLMLTGVALAVVGLAFKASVAPFHQWTPDVYEGAPTPVTAFMAVATKAAAFGILLRLFDVALIGLAPVWAPALAALATVTIVVGNVGALGQTSLKRMLGYSGVAQAGYIMAGVVVSSRLGAEAAVFYLGVYLAMNVAAFAVVAARERETELGDDLAALAGLGVRRPWLAWPMTVAMLSLAGIPATAGFVGKLYLIEAAVDGSYAWLAIVIVVGSMLSLGYYLRVVATMWMAPREAAGAGPGGAGAAGASAAGAYPAIAGGSPEADERSPHSGGDREVVAVAVVAAVASVVLGIVASPLFHLAQDAGRALPGLF